MKNQKKCLLMCMGGYTCTMFPTLMQYLTEIKYCVVLNCVILLPDVIPRRFSM